MRKPLAVGWTLIALLMTISACAESLEPADPVPAQQDDHQQQQETPQDELVENTREIAEMLCEEYGPRRTAKTYGVADATDTGAVAEAYSMDSTEGAHRQAAFEGCFKGLIAWKKKHE